MNKILVVLPVEECHKELFAKADPTAEFIYMPDAEVTRELASTVDVVIGNISASKIAGLDNIKWLQLNSAGTDGYTTAGVLPEGAILTNSTGAYGLAISEHMLGSLLHIMKKLHLYSANQRDHIWHDEGGVTSIEGAKTLVVGYGDIGSEFAKKMHALGSKVTGIRRNKTEKPDFLEGLYQMDMLEQCLAEADIVATCLPGTEQTYHVFNEKTFALMKKDAYFINVGRGNAVDSMALADALNSGQLAGAAVDVTEPEPLPTDHPLWDAKNILITPHISGFFHLKETHERIVRIAARNLSNFVNGKPMENVIDFETGYRRL